jgi:hypothetical protein
VTRTVEVVEYSNAVTSEKKTEVTDEGNRSMMIIIVASIVGVLFLVIVAMIVRVFMNRKKLNTIPHAMIGEVKTGVFEVEPQFVLAADDSKNIFGRASSTPLGLDIERSENKKPGSSENKKRKHKKVVLRKVKDTKSGEEEKEENDSNDDDGFRNYEPEQS